MCKSIINFIGNLRVLGEETDTPPNPPQRSQSLFAKAMSDPNMLEHIDGDDNDEPFDETIVL